MHWSDLFTRATASSGSPVPNAAAVFAHPDDETIARGAPTHLTTHFSIDDATAPSGLMHSHSREVYRRVQRRHSTKRSLRLHAPDGP